MLFWHAVVLVYSKVPGSGTPVLRSRPFLARSSTVELTLVSMPPLSASPVAAATAGAADSNTRAREETTVALGLIGHLTS